MTGDELTTLLLRHGVEVMGWDRSHIRYIVHCRDIATAALSPEMLPSNVELILHGEEHRRDYYLGSSDPIGITSGYRAEIRRIEGSGNFVLTSAPPSTQQLHSDVLRAMRQVHAIPTPRNQQPTNTPSRRYPTPSASTQPPTAPPRSVNDAEVLARIQSHLEASPRRFHWFTDGELRTLGKSACTPPWQRLECAIRDGVSAAAVARLLPSNVFLQLGNTTTGLWGSREDEVFVASAPQQGDNAATASTSDFRVDLWQRICRHFLDSAPPYTMSQIGSNPRLDDAGLHFASGSWWCWHSERSGRDDIVARWRVYQELKPLYDIVDGAVGTALMPRDVEAEWNRQATHAAQVSDGRWSLQRQNSHEIQAFSAPSDQFHGQIFGQHGVSAYCVHLRNFTVVLDAVAEARVAAATTSPVTTQQPPTIRRWDAADLRRAISSDYEIVAVTPMRTNPQTTPKDGRYRVDVRLLETRGYYCSTAILPRGVCVRYDAADGGTTQTIHGENDSLVADLDDWTPTQQINEAELRALVLGLPNVLGISGHIERGSRQRDRYIVRVNLVDRDAPLDSALAPQIPGNVHIHCQGRGEGGMRGVRGTAATMYVPQQSGDHTQQHLQRRLDYDGLVALLRRHLGDDVRVTSIRGNGEGHFVVEATLSDQYGAFRSLAGSNLPQNIIVQFDGAGSARVVGTSSQVFDPGRRVLVDKAPRYFDADGDTVTTPDKAPPWLHAICCGTGVRALWCRRGDGVHLDVVLPYGAVLGGPDGVIQTEEKLKVQLLHQQGILGCVKVAPAPKVEPGIVAALRSGTKLDVIVASSAIWSKLSSDVAMRCLNVVDDIQYAACIGLDDVAAAERCNHYAVLLDEAKQQNISDVDEHVHRWCAQFQTRFALLEVDDADHTAKPRQPSAVLKRGKKPLTLAVVTKFRELVASRMCPSTTEAAKQAGIDSEVAVYVLQRWCGGLGDEEALALLNKVAGHPSHSSGEISAESVDTIAATILQCNRPALDVAAVLPPSVQAADEVAKKQRLVLAQVAEQLRQERQRRAAQTASQPVQELSRFALLDVDEAAPDPATVTKAWQAQRKAPKAQLKSVPITPQQPTFTPPEPQHIDVPTPPHNGVDYVDATMISPQLQELVKVAGLVSAAEQAGLVKRVYEN